MWAHAGFVSPKHTIAPLRLVASMAYFGGLGLLMLGTTKLLIPPLCAAGLRPQVAWFCAATPVFAAMVGISAVALWAEGVAAWGPSLTERLRLRRITRRDLGLCTMALAFTVVLTTLLLGLGFEPTPAFLRPEPLGADAPWILGMWLPFFFINVGGEELLWRGVLLPRQELAFGDRAWFVHALCWLLFHVAFGVPMMVVVAPLIFAQSWACQRSGNMSVGLALHGLVNGAGFVTITLLPELFS